MSLLLVNIDSKNSIRADQIGSVHLLDNDHEKYGYRVRVDHIGRLMQPGATTLVRFDTLGEASKCYRRLIDAVNFHLVGPQSGDAQAQPAPATPEPAQA